MLFSVTSITTFGEVVAFVLPATERVAEFEGPQEVVGFFEGRTASVDFMNEIFNADDVVFAQSIGDDVVVGQSNSLLVDLTVTTFVDQVGDGLERRGTVSDVRFNTTKHSHGGVVDSEEDTVVELTETKKLKNFLGLGVHSHDTSDADNKDNLGFGFNVEVAVVLGLTFHADGSAFGIPVFLDVFLGALELISADDFLGLACFEGGGITLSFDLFESFAFLQKRFWGGNRTVKER